MVDVALQRADSVVRKIETITLSSEEWPRFQDLLLNPPEPNTRLRKAVCGHERVVRK
ncbi:conserved hypothetical protein [Rhodospirillaceae bacterium LM-1]|nr:conserved hypothetical protein [Rhodospirillaceae bacterium LM-1]